MSGRRQLRRFGIIGDIHAEDEMLAAVLDHFSRERLDATLSVGDIVDGPGSVAACCRLLVNHGVVVVRGNHDRWFLRGELRDLPDATPTATVDSATRAFLASLPATRRFDTLCGDLLLCHGVDEDDMACVRPDDFGYALEVNDALNRLVRAGDVRIVVCGHTHRRMVRRFGRLTVINAGTLLRRHAPCFGIADLEAGIVTFFERQGGGAIVTADVVRMP